MFTSFLDPANYSFYIKVISTISLVLSIFAFFHFLFEQRITDIKLGRVKSRKHTALHRIGWFKIYYQNLTAFCKTKDKEHLIETLYGVTFLTLIGTFVFLLYVEQLVLSIVFPIFLFRFLNYILSYTTQNTIEEIEEQLPSAIDRFIRVSTKNDDIKKILYISSLELEEPLRSIFNDLAIKMTSGYKTETLMALGNRFNNIWIWSFVFTLIGYSTNTSKQETIESLRSLRVLLENENIAQKNKTRERKYGVAINYTLCAAAFAGFIANLIFNPIAFEFFFSSLAGLFCLSAGFGAIFVTIIVNVKMVKRQE